MSEAVDQEIPRLRREFIWQDEGARVTPEQVAAMFTRQGGEYGFARWGRPIAPVVFGVDDATLSVVKGAFQAVVAMAGHQMDEVDPELGTNVMMFFLSDWEELRGVPDLGHVVPELIPMLDRLKAGGATRYRGFRFDGDGAIKAAHVFVRLDRQSLELPAEALALGEVAQIMLAWSDTAFQERSPLAVAGQRTMLHPEIAGLIRAAYDPVLPVAAQDASHALRLWARMQKVE